MDQLLPVSMMIKMEASQPFYHWMVYQADHMHNGFVEIKEGCYYHGDWGVFVDWSHSDNRELVYGNPEGMRLALSTMPQEIRYQPKEKHMWLSGIKRGYFVADVFLRKTNFFF